MGDGPGVLEPFQGWGGEAGGGVVVFEWGADDYFGDGDHC